MVSVAATTLPETMDAAVPTTPPSDSSSFDYSDDGRHDAAEQVLTNATLLKTILKFHTELRVRMVAVSVEDTPIARHANQAVQSAMDALVQQHPQAHHTTVIRDYRPQHTLIEKLVSPDIVYSLLLTNIQAETLHGKPILPVAGESNCYTSDGRIQFIVYYEEEEAKPLVVELADDYKATAAVSLFFLFLLAKSVTVYGACFCCFNGLNLENIEIGCAAKETLLCLEWDFCLKSNTEKLRCFCLDIRIVPVTVCIKQQGQMCCLVSAAAIPPDAEVPMMLSVCFLVCFPKFGFFKKISEVLIPVLTSVARILSREVSPRQISTFLNAGVLKTATMVDRLLHADDAVYLQQCARTDFWLGFLLTDAPLYPTAYPKAEETVPARSLSRLGLAMTDLEAAGTLLRSLHLERLRCEGRATALQAAQADGVMVLLSPEVSAVTVRWKEHLKGRLLETRFDWHGARPISRTEPLFSERYPAEFVECRPGTP
ncbi:hypothetical protein AK812_SmicGene18018 [Symbiodinium microadriaticum]|uniref:Uncharacterized protein n=1 Tax=Symbiodinium microadriaticum TaxID=2951 RepID=A0A1Q9DWB2_SYMMI|nr:hypothetical protein AK812_SmicGene18018 [Symbiodinium microadriaticum]